MTAKPRSDRMAAIFRALGHPTRLGVLEQLERGVASPVDFTHDAGNGESLGTVSHHFRSLREAGLIEVAATEQRRGALKRSYRLTADGKQVSAWVKRLGLKGS